MKSFYDIFKENLLASAMHYQFILKIDLCEHTASPHMQITFCIWGLVSYKKSCNESRCRGCQSHHNQGQVPVRQ